MPDLTSTPVEDLAALDRVTELAARYGVAFAGTDVRLRGCIEQEGDRLHALGATLADLIPVLVVADEDAIGSLVVRAIASVGAEIVWPSTDSGEVADRSAGDSTAPTTGHEGERPPGESPVTGMIAGGAGGVSSFGSLMTVAGGAKPNPSAREKILAEVEAMTAEPVPDFAHPRGIRDEAVTLARTPDGDPFGRPVPSRTNMVAAAALLVLAVERLDGER